jgi:hypothetical protein
MTDQLPFITRFSVPIDAGGSVERRAARSFPPSGALFWLLVVNIATVQRPGTYAGMIGVAVGVDY